MPVFPRSTPAPQWGDGLADRPPSDRWLFGADYGKLGMLLFFASLTALFAPLLVVYFLMRLRFAQWPPPGLHPPLAGFLLATGFLISLSVVLHRAVAALRADRTAPFRRRVAVAALLAAAFLGCQLGNWMAMFQGTVPEKSWPAAGFLYVFTAVHALHVVGGIAPLALVLLRSRAGRYSSANCTGARYVAMYWHFLDGVWLVMLAAFLIP
ncbi:MAG: cytochrome c oxidase subunit 3 [Planctomycetes bacterium]|nr:cytochrome c oxidase subunit 3 [Planctomycetota bacterium]